MNAQKRILQVMLWVVVVAGIGGFLILGYARYEHADQIIATAGATAIACAVLCLGAALAERMPTKTAGLLLFPTVLIELLLVVVLIWNLPIVFGRGRGERVTDAIVATTALLPIAMFLIVCSLAVARTRVGPKASWWAAGVIASSFLLIESAIWEWPSPWGARRQAGESNFILLGLAILCIAGQEKSPLKRWGYLGIATALAAWFMETTSIWWYAWTMEKHLAYFGLCAIATVLAHANLCAFAKLRPRHIWVRWIAISATALTSVLVAGLRASAYSTNTNFWAKYEFMLNRVATGAGIIAACGTLCICILAILNKEAGIEPTTHGVEQLQLSCPRCRSTQFHGQNDEACANCGLRIAVQFEEPRCTCCSYLLVGLTGDVCPECGVAFAGPGVSESAPA